MQLIDFIITVFCKIDDMLKIIFKNNRLRQRGPQPKLSDSEAITMEIVGEFFGKDCDEDIHAYFKTHWSNLFPCSEVHEFRGHITVPQFYRHL